MLKHLRLKNFRKHVDRSFDFTPGLNVVRAANEAGKTTTVEAIAYVLGGARACRDSLSEVVTWGQKESSLLVELEFSFEGVDYFCKRHKNGAEVNYDGGRVVGQAEVTAFFEQLFGVPMAIMGKLMMASQGSIRGALDAGPKATMELIEDLADFQVVDRVIELIQGNLVTGPTTAAEDRVQQAQAAVEAAKGAAVAPDVSEKTALIAKCEKIIAEAQKEIDTTLKPAFEKAQDALQAAERLAEVRRGLGVQLEAATAALARQQEQRRQAEAVVAAAPAQEDLDAAQEDIRQAENVAKEREIARTFAALKFPEAYWEGDEASFEAEVRRLEDMRQTATSLLSAAQNDLRAAEAEVRVLEARRITGSACGFCGKDVSGIPEVVTKNAAIDTEIHRQQGMRAIAQTAVTENERVAVEAASTLLDLEAVRKIAEPFKAFLAKYPERVEVVPVGGTMTFPPALGWKGKRQMADALHPADARKTFEQLLQKVDAATQAKGRIAALSEAIEENEGVIAALKVKMAECVIPKVEGLQDNLAKAQEDYNTASGVVATMKYEKEQAQADIRTQQAVYEAALRGVETVKASLAKAEGDLKTLEFNNALLKRVRLARPVIADKLWSLVLSTVSAYFSAMRGEKSLVTREGNAFKVDGHVVGGGSLSGSALDCLGLSLRVALTKTFLPNSPLLTLDEPAAACDDGRTTAMLGFLQTCGFAQTLMVTHEEASEGIAANLIEI